MKHVLKSDLLFSILKPNAEPMIIVTSASQPMPYRAYLGRVKDGYSTSGMIHTTSLGRVMTAVEDEPERDDGNEGPST
jgi:hypothetical protein